jgi:hypothetical protein
MSNPVGRPGKGDQTRITIVIRLPAWLVDTLPAGQRGRTIEAALITQRNKEGAEWHV